MNNLSNRERLIRLIETHALQGYTFRNEQYLAYVDRVMTCKHVTNGKIYMVLARMSLDRA